MNTRKLLSGSIVWSFGIGIPLLYHSSLLHAAVQDDDYLYGLQRMVESFFDLPWVVWIYLVAMVLVGTCLIVSGIKERDDHV